MELVHSNQQKLDSIVYRSQDCLLSAQAVFPFQLFPDKIMVDRAKVTVQKHTFFWQYDSVSVQLEDILNVEADNGPFFASIKIFTRIPNMKPLRVEYLTRRDALRIQSLIEGYIIALAKKVDCSTIPRDQLVTRLIQLGQEAG